MKSSFWRGRRVLVTGHTGFKGGWLSLWLEAMGAQVIGFALPPPTEPSLFEAARVGAGIVSLTGDVRDLETLEAAFKRYRPQIVIHVAAQALVKTAYREPAQTFTTNVIGTLNVLEAARRSETTRVIVSITSDKCYENHEWVWGYRENDRMGGHDPYSASKGCAELLISAYRDSFFPPSRHDDHGVWLASTRAGNVIGGGDWSADRLIPDVMRAITANQPALIRRPHAIRPWQFVLEPLRGYLDLAERLWFEGASFAQAWNFGPDIEQVEPVQWIVDRLTRSWGPDASWVLDEAEHPHEDHFLKLDTTKAKSLLGWRPILELGEALEWIVEWYRGFTDGRDMRRLTEEQIDRYAALQGRDP
jgi:CDP-glucose 4,6-dehydratase